jgi:tryptophan-rich sensory protein
MSTRRSAVGLVVILAITFLAAVAGMVFTSQSVPTWYQSLHRPDWTPPDWIFGPVWTFLYVMMAVAAWLAWRKAGWAGGRQALVFYGVQLVLNAAWSPLFFGLHLPAAALVDLVALWLAILAAAIAFSAHSRVAAWLMALYLAWVTFAGLLNLALCRMNT